jgi:hypothetical protein
MKRRWSLTRLTLAALLISMVVLANVIWPRTASWRVTDESVIGFSESQGLVFTRSPAEETGQLLKGHASVGGDAVKIKAREISSGRERTVFTVPHGTKPPMHYVVSPDGAWLALATPDDPVIQLLSLPGGQVIHRLRLDAPADARFPETEALGFSRDGKRLVGFTLRRVTVWDTTTGKVLATLDGDPAGGSLDPTLAEVDFSDDGNTLALGVADTVLISSIPQGKSLGRIAGARAPRFVGADLIAVQPVWFESLGGARTVRLYRVTATGPQLLPHSGWESPESESEILGVRLPGVLTSEQLPHGESPFPEWLPRVIRDYFNRWLGSDLYRLVFRLRHGLTGEVVQSWSVPVQTVLDQALQGPGFKDAKLAAAGLSPRLSASGLYLAVRDDQGVSLWEARPRPYPRWIISGLIVLAALWLAWPRKEKTVAAVEPPKEKRHQPPRGST